MFFVVSVILFLGISLGSFLNCIIYRLEKEQKPSGRSYCPKCKHTLSYKDLVPLFSYILLLGKCRYCHKKISLEYPLVEFFTGVLFIITLYFSGFLDINNYSFFDIFTLAYLFIVLFFLILIFIYDLKHFIIPDFANFSLVIISFLYLGIYSFFENNISIFINGLLSAFFVFLFFFAIFYFTKGKGMGFGDVKFVVFMGFFLGFPNILVANFLSFFFGAIIGLLLIIIRKKKMKSEIPFGPFLIFGTYIAYFFGDKIIQHYFSYF